MVDSSADTHTHSLAHTNIIICLRASYSPVLSSPRFFCVALPPFHEAGVGKLVTQLEAVHVLPPPFFGQLQKRPRNAVQEHPQDLVLPIYVPMNLYLCIYQTMYQSVNL